MNKQELLTKIEELKKQIEKIEIEVNSPEFEGIKKGVRQMPECGERYYFLNDMGLIVWTNWLGRDSDLFRFNSGNCFKTEEEAIDFKENLLTKQALKDLASELNEEVKLDWQRINQFKYFIFYDFKDEELDTGSRCFIKSIGQVYCRDKNFLNVAISRIGKQKLIKLIESGV